MTLFKCLGIRSSRMFRLPFAVSFKSSKFESVTLLISVFHAESPIGLNYQSIIDIIVFFIGQVVVVYEHHFHA